MDPLSSVQTLLKRWDPGIVVDGIHGLHSSEAINALTILQHDTLSFVTGYRSGRRMARFVPVSEIDEAIDIIAERLGVSHLSRAAKYSLRKEAAVRRDGNGQLLVDVDSKKGSYRGIFQFGEAAWTDAASEAKKLGMDIGGYDKVWDIPNNIAAMLSYLRRTEKFLTARKIQVTNESLYLSHNQGLGFWSGITTNVEGQSAAVQALISEYIS